jgi:RNA polymerase sigma-70 factor (ECF subfamily)
MNLGALSDHELVCAAGGGDPHAFEQLHRRYRSVVEGVVRAEARAHSDVEDIVQEVFVRAWAKLSSLRDPGLFRPWLLQIARRAIVDHYRHGARRPPLTNDDEIALGTLASDLPTAPEVVELRDLARTVERGIEGLSRRDATALSLAIHFGFGPSEIGEALGITPGNAKVVLHRARKRLRDQIEQSTGTKEVTA